MYTRRHILASTFAAPAILRFGIGTAHAATTLKISHQFPGGTIDKGDFRDRLCRVFAAELAKRTGGEITAEIYPNSSLIKTNAQFSAMRKGALDISLYPLPYAGGELPETNIALMPGLVSTYDQGMSWKKNPVGKTLTDFLADKGIIILSWVWQAGGVASRSRSLVLPEDAKGLRSAAARGKWTWCFRRREQRCCRYRQTTFTPPCKPAPATLASPPPPA
jgi:TRAP-type C4-dicarboxylate transport system substrate-binding protein